MGLKKFIKRMAERTGIADEIRRELREELETDFLNKVNIMKAQIIKDVRAEYDDCIVVRKGENFGLIHKTEYNKVYMKGWRKDERGKTWQEIHGKEYTEVI